MQIQLELLLEYAEESIKLFESGEVDNSDLEDTINQLILLLGDQQ